MHRPLLWRMVIVHFNKKLIAYVNTGIDPGMADTQQIRSLRSSETPLDPYHGRRSLRADRLDSSHDKRSSVLHAQRSRHGRIIYSTFGGVSIVSSDSLPRRVVGTAVGKSDCLADQLDLLDSAD